jgi:hypothetical protein
MIWIEILSRHREVVSRQRFDRDSVTLGRGYDNDVVLDDPYVAASHVRIVRREDGTLVAEDLGSVNGIQPIDGGEAQREVVLDGNRVVRIGRTLVRARGSEFAVPAERPVGSTVREGRIILALAGALLVFSLVTLWTNETVEPKLSHFLLPILLIAAIVLVWTTSWAVMSRIFSGAARFERHLLIALSGLVAFSVFDTLADYGTFSLSLRALAEYEYVGNWLLLGALCFFHLREIGPLHPQRKAIAVAVLAILAIVTQSVTKSERSSQYGQQSYLTSLKPPFFRLKPARAADAFFADTERVKSAVDKARLEPPSSGSFLPDFDDD